MSVKLLNVYTSMYNTPTVNVNYKKVIWEGQYQTCFGGLKPSKVHKLNF